MSFQVRAKEWRKISGEAIDQEKQGKGFYARLLMERTNPKNQILDNQTNPMYLYRGSFKELQAINQMIQNPP